MKLPFKTIDRDFEVEAELSDTVGALKEKIFKEYGYPVASQKITFSGQFLWDSTFLHRIQYRLDILGQANFSAMTPNASKILDFQIRRDILF